MDDQNTWKRKTEEITNKLGIPKASTNPDIKKNQIKKIIKGALDKDLSTRMYSASQTKSKIKHLLTCH